MTGNCFLGGNSFLFLTWVINHCPSLNKSDHNPEGLDLMGNINQLLDDGFLFSQIDRKISWASDILPSRGQRPYSSSENILMTVFKAWI